MKRVYFSIILPLFAIVLCAQSYSLNELRTMALENNKQLKVSKIQQDIAADAVREAKTKYLPRVNAMAGYDLFSREISILNNRQKAALNNVGTNAVNNLQPHIGNAIAAMQAQGVITAQEAAQLGAIAQQMGQKISEKGDAIGHDFERAFRTNTHNIFAGNILVTQPVYMGGAITAANKILTTPIGWPSP